MTLNNIKKRIGRLETSKPKGIHVFTLHECDLPEKKAEILRQVEALEKQGEESLLITINIMKGPEDLEKNSFE
jgi:hypothetical protein